MAAESPRMKMRIAPGGLDGENMRLRGASKAPRKEPPAEVCVGRICAGSIGREEEPCRISAPQSKAALQQPDEQNRGEDK